MEKQDLIDLHSSSESVPKVCPTRVNIPDRNTREIKIMIGLHTLFCVIGIAVYSAGGYYTIQDTDLTLLWCIIPYRLCSTILWFALNIASMSAFPVALLQTASDILMFINICSSLDGEFQVINIAAIEVVFGVLEYISLIQWLKLIA